MKKCQHEDCDREGFECFLPCEDEPNGFYCGEHAAEQGFCCICGIFSAGIESFDFLHPGFCDTCHSELEEHDDSDLEFYE